MTFDLSALHLCVVALDDDSQFRRNKSGVSENKSRLLVPLPTVAKAQREIDDGTGPIGKSPTPQALLTPHVLRGD